MVSCGDRIERMGPAYAVHLSEQCLFGVRTVAGSTWVTPELRLVPLLMSFFFAPY